MTLVRFDGPANRGRLVIDGKEVCTVGGICDLPRHVIDSLPHIKFTVLERARRRDKTPSAPPVGEPAAQPGEGQSTTDEPKET